MDEKPAYISTKPGTNVIHPLNSGEYNSISILSLLLMECCHSQAENMGKFLNDLLH